MGFNVLYFPPIHPIGVSYRKGRNNTLHAAPGDPGSPYAIGAPAGGHDSVHPLLGGISAFRRLLAFRSLRSSYFQHGRVEPWPRIRDIEWFDEKGNTMRPEHWQFGEGRLLSVRRSVRRQDESAEISLLMINNTGDSHSFSLPQPALPWVARIDSAHPELEDRELEGNDIDVEAHSVQLLTAVVAAEPPQTVVHAAEDTAPEPEQVS